MADPLTSLSELIPSKASTAKFGTSAFQILTIFVIVALVLIIVGVIVYIILNRLKFNKKIRIFEKVGAKWEEKKPDRAREVKYGRAGDTVFYLKRFRKYLPRPEMQTGRGTYWFAIREDGEWINVTLGDIDLQMKEAKVKYLHPEMRYARTQLQRGLKERYDKPKFFEKYGAMLINIAAIAIIMIFLYLIVDKIISVGDKVTAMVDSADKVMEKAQQVLVALANVCK